MEDSQKDFKFTKINSKLTNKDLNQLTKECTNAVQHGHAGMVIPEAKYITFLHNAEQFVIPNNLGPYPAMVDADAVVHDRQIAEHKAVIAEYETYQVV
ncbi:hypothetical protein ACHAW6_012457 [Cyclotella cf. meneghiniana]